MSIWKPLSLPIELALLTLLATRHSTWCAVVIHAFQLMFSLVLHAIWTLMFIITVCLSTKRPKRSKTPMQLFKLIKSRPIGMTNSITITVIIRFTLPTEALSFFNGSQATNRGRQIPYDTGLTPKLTNHNEGPFRVRRKLSDVLTEYLISRAVDLLKTTFINKDIGLCSCCRNIRYRSELRLARKAIYNNDNVAVIVSGTRQRTEDVDSHYFKG